jgi:hypothetical protein
MTARRISGEVRLWESREKYCVARRLRDVSFALVIKGVSAQDWRSSSRHDICHSPALTIATTGEGAGDG